MKSLILLSLGLTMTACATERASMRLAADHPASTQAMEAPLPAVARVLQVDAGEEAPAPTPPPADHHQHH